MRDLLIERERERIGLDDFREIIAIAHAREAMLLLRGGEVRKVIDLAFLHFQNVQLRLFG